MGDDDLNLVHIGHHRRMTTDVANGFTACDPVRRSAGFEPAIF